jgi:hypothetical protein
MNVLDNMMGTYLSLAPWELLLFFFEVTLADMVRLILNSNLNI